MHSAYKYEPCGCVYIVCLRSHLAKRNRRKAVRKWLLTRSNDDLCRYKAVKNNYNQLLYKSKCSFFNDKIINCGNDSKQLFGIINDILHKKKPSKLPDHVCPEELAERFSTFFSDKIQCIRDGLSSATSVAVPRSRLGSSLDSFTTTCDDEVGEIILMSPSPSCVLDPIPSWLVKQILDTLIPTISSIVNASLKSGVVPSCLKSAVITPMLKKPSLDANTLKNYRPVSNLTFISKVLERVVARQLTNYMSDHHLHEPMQSAYKRFHSTETALLRVHNDIMWTMEKQGITILVLLDLSAAFDTIDHKVLLARMEELLGVQDIPLKWFASYLSGRTQRLHINNHFSQPRELLSGVPQGSVLGPLLFLIIYSSSWTDHS